ncbi:Carbonic anhydrase [Trametes pubescens]|uniref:Carbonic anhydrase n=1 Tax=Trametes pubescens TaxID=154538 RepID=A0A1M2W1N2_TRAPU|nr:Carbonic anhydrase [Trametes pubescens]
MSSRQVLYIGCSDWRVPESAVSTMLPGGIFVHRNIANQFHLDDDNALSVLAYAVEHLKVSHIIVAGHTLCGGAEAALAAAHASCPPPPPSGPLARWLVPLTEIAREYEDLTELIEANVRAQVNNVAGTDVVRAAWADNKRKLQVHGWIYDLGTGRFRDMGISVDGPSKDDVL